MSRRSNQQTVLGMNWKWMVLIGASLVVILVGATAGVSFFSGSWTVGGTGWMFDYEWSEVTIKGTNAQDGSVWTETYTEGESPSVWTHDVDGSWNPDVHALNLTGRLPSLVMTCGVVGRVDKDGEFLDWDAEDPNLVSFPTEGGIVHLYYYQFEIKFATASHEAAVASTVHTEYGELDVTAKLTIYLKEEDFNITIDGGFRDARIGSIDYTDPLVNPGLAYSFEPYIDMIQDEGDRVDFSNVQDTTLPYSGDLLFRVRLAAGAVISGFSTLKYDVYVVKQVRVGLTLKNPLAVGDPSKIRPFNPPPIPPNPLDFWAQWWMQWGWIIIIIVVLLLVCVCCTSRGGMGSVIVLKGGG